MKLTHRYLAFGCLCTLMLQALNGFAQTAPLWELGMGLAAFQAPEYRGDTRQNYHLLPFPLLIYRGKYLRFSREGVSGLLFQSEVFKLDVSGNGSTSVHSANTDLRRGLPDLPASVEFGPALDMVLFKDKEKKRELGLAINLRAAYSVHLGDIQTTAMDHQGWTSQPHVYYENNAIDGGDLHFAIASGPVFATRAYHQFYYRIPQEIADATRPSYDASSGYSGLRSTVSLSRHFGALWVGVFVRYEYLGSAVYDNSPLYGSKSFLITGVAMNYIVKQSSRLVQE